MWLWIYYDCACYLMLEWERDSKKKKREKFGQEDHMLKLTFNFHGALSILTFYENELTLFTEKIKKTKAKEKQKMGRKKKKRKKREEK